MANVTYGKDIMASVIMAKILWQMKLSHLIKYLVYLIRFTCTIAVSPAHWTFKSYNLSFKVVIPFQSYHYHCVVRSESEFNEFESRLKSAKNRFQLSAVSNLKKVDAILSGTNPISAASQI